MNARHTPTSARAVTRLGKASLGSASPRRRVLGGLVAGVLVVHLAVLWGMTGPLEWRLETAETQRIAPLQTRSIAAAVLPTPAPTVSKAPPRTRLATLPSAPKVTAPEREEPVLPETTSARPSESDASSLSASPETAANAQVPSDALPAGNVAQRADTPAAAPAPAIPPDTALSTPPPPPTATVAATPAESPASASAWPPVPLGALPPPVLLSYRLTGQDKGLNYFASGEMRWQHNDTAYALSLSVKAFLVGSRHWRSVGDITASGLAPRRFSDSWRSERAAHFDRANQRVVFSSNAPVVPLEAGAQDQISLYVQLAAAMAGEPQRFEPGARLQLQTVTTRDALPWLLTLGDSETLQLEGGAVNTFKWVCQPRNRFDATVAFWVSAKHAWMPVRIRITQVSGSFIDLQLTDQQALPPLPPQATAPEKTTPS